MYIFLTNITNASWGGRWRGLRDNLKEKIKTRIWLQATNWAGKERNDNVANC